MGLIGYPNVGKSTLLSAITSAKPQIANYHFTTLSPNLGVVNYYDHSFVVADIPGLIKGASQGIGLGHDFLRHVERTRLLVHVVDLSATDGRDPYDDFLVINKELKDFSPNLAKLPQIVALNKCDLLYKDKAEKVAEFKEKLGNNYKVVAIAAASKDNVKELVREVWNLLSSLPVSEPIQTEIVDFDVKDVKSIIITREGNAFVLGGGYIEQLIRGVVLSDYQSSAYFQKRLRDDGIIKMLKEKGAKEGDTVRVSNIDFEFME